MSQSQPPMPAVRNAAFFNELGREHLPDHLGIIVTAVGNDGLDAELPLRKALMAPNGFLHAGTVVTLADTAAGYACLAHLPEGATSFTTIELKTNFLGTARTGTIRCRAQAVHLGRTTQVWDATVSGGDKDRPIALFRCTQMILYPR
jgi:1,4-dihydroxy-2-naphthoyl-CoA hydrolase